MKNKFVFINVCLLCFTASYLSVQAQNERPFIIPALQQWTGGKGFFKLKTTTNLVVANKTEYEKMTVHLNTFLDDLNTLYPFHHFAIRVGKPATGDIYFKLNNEKIAEANEAYRLLIDDYITIEADESIGAFWATRSILQMLETSSNKLEVPKGNAFDFPKFAVRGFVLDVGRKFFTIDFLRNYVKLLSYYKMNDFQIHLNDNGFPQFFNNNWDATYSAFRLENKTYPGLTAKDGSYSKKEFIQLQQLGKAYGVTIVPEIDVPAHALSFSKAIPEIASSKYGKDHLDINNPLTYKVVDTVFKEYLQGPSPVFIGPEVHIGTDEYAKNEAEAFRAFTDHCIKYVESFGKKVRMWGALTHTPGKTPVKVKDVTLNLWYNGYADPKEMFKLGYKGISTPDGWLYIVPKAGYYYDYLDLENLYKKWTPSIIGDDVFPEDYDLIRGGSFAVWNDHVGNGITEKDVHDRVFPALQVLSQKMWIGSRSDSMVAYSDFSLAAKKIGEGPGLNIRGKITAKDNLVLSYKAASSLFIDGSGNGRNAISMKKIKLGTKQKCKGWKFNKQSLVELPVQGIGYDYTVSFNINPEAGNSENAILFSSSDANVKLCQQHTGKIGFSREGYDYFFNYKVPENTWTNIVITGNNVGTSLYVNGVLIERLEGAMQEFNGSKDKIAKVQTLFFPLRFIGDGINTFKGYIDNIKVFNRILSEKEMLDFPKK